MFKIKLLNIKTNETFELTFNSYYLYNKALIKYRHSKKLQIISTEEIR